MKNVIVTGATSFIGSQIVNELIKHGCNVTAVVRPNSKKIEMMPISDKIEVVYLDINDIELLPNKIGNKQFDVFYHFAWEGIRVPYRDDNILQERNYNATVNAMNVAIELKCKKIICAGSQAEYGKCIGRVDENHKTIPTTEYGKAKLKTYNELEKIAKNNNIDLIWTRIFSVYGKFDYEGTLIMSSINKMLKNESIDLTLCTQKWDYIYVDDVAKIMYLLGKKKCNSGVYNVASGNARPLKEFVLVIKNITNSKSKLNFGAIPLNNEAIVSFEPVVEKLKRTLEWNSQTDFCDGIRRIVQYIKQKG